MRKKILFVNSSLTDGGSERVMTLLANELANNDYDVTMVLVREKNKDTYILDEKINCIRFKYGTKNKVIIALKRIMKLRKIMKDSKFDSVISFMYDINLTTIIASRGLKLPIIVSERANPNARKKNKLYKWFEHKLYLKAKNIVFQTMQVKEMFAADIQEKGIVIPNPVNENLPQRFEGKREKNIVAAGRLSEQKNFKMLISSFAKVHEKYPEYKLTIYGEGNMLESLKEQSKNLNIEEYVQFPGYVSDVNLKMRNATMYVSSSNFEGISNSMIEALAMGIPTICTDCPVGGAAMMIDNEVNGILIPVGNEEKLYDSMIKIIENEDFANFISQNAIKIKENYSIKKIADKWEKLF